MTEPISPEPPSDIGRTLLTQSWLDLALLHWAAEPDLVQRPATCGNEPDVLDGGTYVGLIAFRMHRVGWLGLPGLPYFGTFPETNVRLYSVDEHGRRGGRVPLAGRVAAAAGGDRARRVPAALSLGPDVHPARGRRARLRQPTPLAGAARRAQSRSAYGSASASRSRANSSTSSPRAGVCTTTGSGGRSICPNAHPRWPLYRAELLTCEDELVQRGRLTRADRRSRQRAVFARCAGPLRAAARSGLDSGYSGISSPPSASV